MTDNRGPLTDMKVIELAHVMAGPTCGRMLADMGADVIKVERVPDGDDTRRFLPPDIEGESAAYMMMNRNKRGVAIDLKNSEGKEVLIRMIADADVVIENYRANTMVKLGLGYDDLKPINPGLIYCSLSGYGQDGHYRDRAGHDLNYQALAGIIGLAGPKNDIPALPATQVADIGVGALWSLVGILSALVARQSTGKGQWLDVSMTDGSLGFLHMTLASFLGGQGDPPGRGADTLSGGLPCYAVYETQDKRHMTLAALEPKFWLAFCQATNRPDLVKLQFGGKTPEGHTAWEAIADLFASRTRAEWEDIFRDVDACVEPVLEPDEIAAHPLHQARQNIVEDTSGMRRLRTPLADPAQNTPGPSPALGEHTESLLAELGYSADDISELKRKGVVAPSESTS